MKINRLLPLAAAVASLAASAQTTRPVLAVADPAAQVAALNYQSVFPSSATPPEEQPSPDLLWVDANRQVAGPSLGMGHAGHAVTEKTPEAATQAAQETSKQVETRGMPKHDGHHAPVKEK